MFQQSPAEYDTDIALAKCASAAMTWHDSGLDGRLRLASMTDAMAWIGRANGGRLRARTLADLRELLKEPTSTYIPSGEDSSLVEDGALSDFARDVVAEAGDGLTGSDLEAEVVQNYVAHARQSFARHPNGSEQYANFRRFLIEHPTGDFSLLQDGLLAADIQPGMLYEPIPPSCRTSSLSEDICFPCPRCHWPMRIGSELVKCSSQLCRASGASFRRNNDRRSLLPLGGHVAPVHVAVTSDLGQLRRGVWRYTLLPGLSELALAEQLQRVKGASVELWPERDQFDLRVEVRDRVWRIDVKDWSSAPALARSLNERDATEPLHIVVPAYRAHQIRILRDRCRVTNFLFCADRDLVAEVRAYAAN